MVESGLKVSISCYSDYSNDESLDSGDLCSNTESMKQGDNDPAEGYMIKGGNKTVSRQMQVGIPSVCIQQGEQRIPKQHICYCDMFQSNVSHFYYSIVMLVIVLILQLRQDFNNGCKCKCEHT